MRALARISVGLAAALFVASSAGAQSRSGARAGASSVSSDLFDVTPYVGYIVFGNYYSGPLGSGISNAPATLMGVQVGMHVSPELSMIGNVATGSSDIQAGLPILGGLSVAQSTMLFYDAGLQLDIPITSAMGYTFSPFIQAAAGGMHYEITESGFKTSTTNLAGVLGAGADIALGNGMGLRLMARDYIGKFNFQDATTLGVDGGTTQSVAFNAGLRFSF